jgi:hypothetical protein
VTDDDIRLMVRDVRKYGLWTFLASHSYRVVADLLDELLARRAHDRFRRVGQFYDRSAN